MLNVETEVYSVSEQDTSGVDALGYAGSNEYAVAELVGEEADDERDELTALEVAYQTELDDESETLDTPMEQEQDEDTVVLYTTAAMGDLPGTVVLDQHVDTCNHRAIRAIGCRAEKAQEQTRAYQSQDRRVWTEEEWEVYQDKFGQAGYLLPSGGREAVLPDVTQEAQPGTPSNDRQAELPDVQTTVPSAREAERLYESAELLYATHTTDTPWSACEETAQPAPEIPQAILEAESLAQAAKAAQDQLKALQEQMKVLAEQSKLLATQAAQAKAAAPVLITPELRQKIDRYMAIGAGGEQAIAKALVNAEVYVKIAGSAKKDTGIIRKVAAKANSTGIVDIHHMGDGSTVVTGGRAITEERRALVLDIKARIAALPAGIVADTQIAKQVGLDPRKGAKLVYNIRVGDAYADIN